MATRIPINKDSGGLGFEDRQKRIWDEMESDMERRRRDWEHEIEKMRKEFFVLRPEGEGRGGGLGGTGMGSSFPLGLGERVGPRSRLLETTTSSSSSSAADESRGVVVKDDKGNPVFKVLFDVHEYRPEEVSVKMDANKIMVSARHEAQQGGSSVSREYSRQVNIPSNIDPITLQCTMGPDGILAVEAPLPAPSYSSIKDSTTTLPIKTGSPGLSTSSTATATPLQQSASSSAYQTYQPLRESGMSTGSKAVSSPLHKSSPPPSTGSLSPAPASSVGSSSQSSRESTGYTKASPAFKAATSGGGRIGSPVVVSDAGNFRLEVDIEDFKPDELTVKTQDMRVVVCAKREEKVGNRSSSRELSREYTIPESVDPLTIKAFFTDGGKLIIEAPYREAGSQSQITSR